MVGHEDVGFPGIDVLEPAGRDLDPQDEQRDAGIILRNPEEHLSLERPSRQQKGQEDPGTEDERERPMKASCSAFRKVIAAKSRGAAVFVDALPGRPGGAGNRGRKDCAAGRSPGPAGSG
jgi:hypothetical protein